MENLKIPKTIHYVWVGGGEKPKHIKTCIDSWKKFCPDYKIIEWNEHHFNVDKHPFVKQALVAKNWALMSDVIRVWVLYHYGGVYFDTDLELVAPIDDLLKYDAFFCYEAPYWFGSAVLGTVKGHQVFKRVLKRYDKAKPIKFNTNPLTVHAFTAALRYDYHFKPTGQNTVIEPNIGVLSPTYFFPQHYMSGKLIMTEQTRGIHHYFGSWHTKSQSKGQTFASGAYRILGKHIFKIFELIVSRRYYKLLKKEYRMMDKEA